MYVKEPPNTRRIVALVGETPVSVDDKFAVIAQFQANVASLAFVADCKVLLCSSVMTIETSIVCNKSITMVGI